MNTCHTSNTQSLDSFLMFFGYLSVRPLALFALVTLVCNLCGFGGRSIWLEKNDCGDDEAKENNNHI